MPSWSHRLERAWAVRGPLAWALLPIALVFAALTATQRCLYQSGLLRSERLPVRVIVVGNLLAGGAGKTPTVLALVALLVRQGRAPAIVSRGYRGAATGALEVQPDTPAQICGDEPLLLRRRAGVPVFVGRDRVGAIRELLRAHPRTDVVVSDDGLQHRRLARDVQVLVFDERGAGNGWPLPSGPLREPLPREVPPSSVVLYNAPHATTSLCGWTAERRLGGVVELDAWWKGRPPNPETLPTLRKTTVVAAAGVARPERFFAMLRATGLAIVELSLPDHFDFDTLPWPAGTADVIVTEKDAIKLDPARLAGTRVWVAALDFVPAPGFDAEVLRLLGPPAPSSPSTVHGNAPA